MEQTSLEALLRGLAERAPALRSALPPLTEADTCGGLIEPTLQALGWNTFDVLTLRRQYRRNTSDNPVDYALLLDGTPVLFVEAKSLSGDLDDNRWRNQTLAYAYHAGVEWCALTNGLEWRLYKTMAPGDAASRLFRCIKVSDPSAAKLLGLISPNSLKAGAASRLWEAEHAERLVRDAYRAVVQSRDFASMVRKNLAEQLPLDAVVQAIQRIGLPWEDGADAKQSPPPEEPTRLVDDSRNGPSHPESKVDASIYSSEPNRSRIRKERLPALFADGRLRAGQTVRIRDRPNSAATLIDAETVRFEGRNMSWNEWGQKVTNWPSINIYLYAETEDGVLIEQLRRPL